MIVKSERKNANYIYLPSFTFRPRDELIEPQTYDVKPEFEDQNELKQWEYEQ